jgi:hypothetical protein
MVVPPCCYKTRRIRVSSPLKRRVSYGPRLHLLLPPLLLRIANIPARLDIAITLAAPFGLRLTLDPGDERVLKFHAVGIPVAR